MSRIKWVVDPAHSELFFKVRHLMIATVTGKIEDYNVTAETEEHDLLSAKIRLSANVNSLSTGNESRDEHLKSPDFFDAEHFPEIKFESTRIEKVDDEMYLLFGNLTIKDVTKEVKLNVEMGGIITDNYGKTRAGFTVVGKINRKDFGLTWSALTESGGVVVGDEVTINSEIQLVKEENQPESVQAGELAENING